MACRKRNLGCVAVWLVAEDRVQILRADSVVTYAITPVKPSGNTSADPVARLPNDRVRILAGTRATRDPDAQDWTVLLTFTIADGAGKTAVKVLRELAVTLGEAEARARTNGTPALFVHGPLPRLTRDPVREKVWHISEDLPLKDWPTSGSFWRDPLQ